MKFKAIQKHFLLLFLFPLLSYGQSPNLVKDIKSSVLNPSSNEYNSGRKIAIGNHLFFFTEDPCYGIELFVTDGTTDGTRLVKDIFPGESTSMGFPINFAAFQNELYFVANDGATGFEIWKSNGTVSGTNRITDFPLAYNSQYSFSSPSQLTTAQNQLYFLTDNRRQLWAINSTGSVDLIQSFNNNNSGQEITTIIPTSSNTTYFITSDLSIWKTDGTNQGTMLLGNLPININNGSYLNYFLPTIVNNDLYLLFQVANASSPVSNYLYKTTTTPGTLTLVKEFDNTLNFNFNQPLATNGKLTFVERSLGNIWVSDGSETGTQIISNFGLGAYPGTILPIQLNPNQSIYVARDDEPYISITSTDGTTTNSFEIIQIPVTTNEDIKHLGTQNGIAYFAIGAFDSPQSELWQSDGTTNGTFFTGVLLPTVQPSDSPTVTDNGLFYFISLSQPIGIFNLWQTDLTQNGTKAVGEEVYSYNNGAHPSNFVTYNNQFFFKADDDNGSSTWITDGTNSGTQKANSILPAIANSQSSSEWQGFLYYSNGDNIYKTDGSNSSLAFQGNTIQEVNTFNNKLLFTTVDIGGGGFPFYDPVLLQEASSDGNYTEVMIDSDGWTIQDLSNFKVINGDLYFISREGLFIGGSTQGCCAYFRNGIYRYDGTTIFPLQYYADGQNVSTPPLSIEYVPGLGNELATLNNEVFFTDHRTLFKTGNGSDLITTITTLPEVDYLNFDYLSSAHGLLYFSANDGISGYEIWRSDGTSAGTFLLKDLNPGSLGSCPKQVVEGPNGKSYFLTDNCNKDFAIWETDGTASGTNILADLSNFFSIDDSLYVFNGQLYFAGNDGQSGKELWSISLSSNPPNNGVDLELTIAPGNPNVDIYQEITLSLTLSNTGIEDAGSLVIDFPTPAGLAFVSQNVPTGTFNNWTGQWTIPGLTTGQSVSMDLTLFTLTTDPVEVYAQVTSTSESDIDSTPGNGTPPIANEDDEASTTINGGTTSCSFTDFNLVVSDCQDNGTSDLSDDYFTFSIQPIGINLGNSYTITGITAGGSSFTIPDILYGNPYLSTNQLLSNGDIALQIIDINGICIASFNVPAPSPCTIVNTSCSNNLLLNPGYEDNNNFPDGWYSLGGTSITSDANSGNGALLISGPSTGGILQNLPASSNQTYTLQAKVKLDPAAGVSFENYISLKFLSSSWQPIYTETETVFPSVGFEDIMISFTAPANTAYVEAKAYKGNGNYDMIVDDWCLTTGSSVDPCDNDTEAPVITFCPNDITVNTPGTSTTVSFIPTPIFTDNCGATFVSAPSIDSNTQLSLGTYIMSFVIGDISGNQVMCDYNIVVQQIAPTACADNLVTNPGFENGLNGWFVPSGNWQLTTDALSGQQALAVRRFDGSSLSGFATQIIPINGNKKYTITGHFQNAGPGVAIVAQAYDIDNNPLGALDVTGDLYAPEGYSALTLEYITPPNASTLDLRLVNTSTGFVEIDDVCISEGEISVNNGVDLELDLTASTSSFDPWQSFDMTVTLTNTGSTIAENIIVDFPEPDGVVFQGGNEYTASQGTFNPYDPQEWVVGNLAPGATAMISFHLFTIQGNDPITGYAQVLSMDQGDVDSTPGNGTCCTTNEDDEAVVSIQPLNNDPISRKTDLKDGTPFSAIKIYPNPANNWATLLVNTQKESNTPIKIYDLKGSLLLSKQVDLIAGINQIQIDLSELEAGMYMILFPDERGKQNRIRFSKID